MSIDHETRILTDPAAAAAVLADGGLVGLPTETVYGLAADADNPAAVRRVFNVKGRPHDHPLIVHLASGEHLDAWAHEVPAQLRALADRHWPGPLTIVVPRSARVSDSITGGQHTVALRVPGAHLAREVIGLFAELVGDPAAGVVAPSANRFGQVSPTTAAHVARGLAGRMGPGDAVLDGGPCDVGVESTIVAWVDGAVRVLRPGAISVAPDHPTTGSAGTEPRVPGSVAAHYAPTARVILVSNVAEAAGVISKADRVGLLAPATVTTPPGWLRLAAPRDTIDYARVLYDALRRADDAGLDIVVAVAPQHPDGALRDAILDRLTRAAAAVG